MHRWKKLISKRIVCIVCIVLYPISLYPVNDFTNNHRIVLTLAESLLIQQKYYDAITEFKRYQYLKQDKSEEIYQKISYCYSKLDDYLNSIKYIDKAIELSTNESIKSIKTLEKSAILIRFGEINSAEYLLTKEFYFSNDKNVQCTALTLLFLCQAHKGDFLLYKSLFDQHQNYAIECDCYDNILNSYIEINNFKFKDPRKAERLSKIVPGLGQVYSGYYFEGINAFILNFGLLYLTINSLISLQLSDTISFAVLFERFYTGNYHRAAGYSVEKNKILVRQIISEIYRCI